MTVCVFHLTRLSRSLYVSQHPEYRHPGEERQPEVRPELAASAEIPYAHVRPSVGELHDVEVGHAVGEERGCVDASGSVDVPYEADAGDDGEGEHVGHAFDETACVEESRDGGYPGCVREQHVQGLAWGFLHFVRHKLKLHG